MKKQSPLQINITARDGIQSNHGTNIPAEHIVKAYSNSSNYGVSSFQTAGGTFHDLPIKKGWNPFDFNEKITSHFKEQTQSALIRGECGLNYSRQSLDTLSYLVERYTEMGINRWQNFHAMNDINMMRGVPLIVNRLREEKGLDVSAMGAITAQENPNTISDQSRILDDIYRFAEQLIETGHQGFYIKNANGVLRPDFTGELVSGLNERFDEEVHLHTHNTYGYAYDNYLAAIEAGVTGVDVLPDALAEGTAQPALGTLIYAMEQSGSDTVIARLPVGIDMEAIEKDRDEMLIMRATYSQTEMPFNLDRIKIAEEAGSAGGAISALKGMEIVQGVAQKMGTDDWDTIQKAIYEQKARNREALGYPTNVTPHELMQDLQAAADIYSGGEPLANLTPLTQSYLIGDLGRVSDSVDPDVQKRALDFHNMDSVRLLPKIEELEPTMPAAREKLIEKGIKNPTDDEIAIVASSGADGEALVLGETQPQEQRHLMRDQQKGGALHNVTATMLNISYTALELTKLKAGFYDGVNGVEQRAQELQEQINSDVKAVENSLKNDGHSRSVARKAASYINIFSNKIGADTSNIPRFDIRSFPIKPAEINKDLAPKESLSSVMSSSSDISDVMDIWDENVDNYTNNTSISIDEDDSFIEPDNTPIIQ